jgi:nicotinate-nucleotide pyrophosphorylase (carboxylating)
VGNLDHLTAAIVENVAIALSEDLGSGDITADLIPADATARAIVTAREALTLAGQPWVDEIYRQLDERISVDWMFNDGDRIREDSEICVITGPARAILSGERTALNFLQTLSATATQTARYVAAIKGTRASILDTRKTIPGLRHAQKYAVRCGGGSNHRVGLYDAVLVKENHIISAGGIAAAIAAARRKHNDLPVEVEVESIDELREALAAGADRLLLDNFTIDELKQAVEINQDEYATPADLEASGGITIDNIRGIAETGVDYISVGALTKNVKAVDLSMRFKYAS